jgi:hypothetical protein
VQSGAIDPKLPYSITSSARRSAAVGTSMPSAFAALRFMAVVGLLRAQAKGDRPKPG